MEIAVGTSRRRRADGRRRHVGSRGRSTAALVLVLAVLALLAVATTRLASAEEPLSVLDEHAHYDYALRIHEGTVPLRGMVYSDELVHEWACGVGHEAGAPWTCDDAAVSADTLPSGRYTSGYIHYPTYYVAAEGARRVLEAVGAPVTPLTAYRLFSALCTVLGAAACAAAAWQQGLRRSALVAGALSPVAAAVVVMIGVIVNPSAVAILTGALVAWSALHWARTGRGFVWVALAAAAAAGTAATNSLPVIGVGLAAAAVWWRRWTGRTVLGEWAPRVWQVGVLAAVVALPVVVWGRVIEARATVPDSALYGAYPISSKAGLITGALTELGPHTPWYDPQSPRLDGTGPLAPFARALAFGTTTWLGYAVLVAVLLVAVGATLRSARTVERLLDGPVGAAGDERATGPAADAAPTDAPPAARWANPVVLLAIAPLVVLVVYPPLLRLSNALTMGFDTGIVQRYSMALMPALVLSLLCAVPDRRLSRLLAALATTVVLCVAVGGL